MAFTKVAGKTGVFRHVDTKFIVHEVFNTQQVLDANGVFVEYSNGYWIWLAGRDLRDFMQSRAVTSLNDFAAGLAPDKRAIGTYNVVDAAAEYAAVFPMVVNASKIIQTAKGFPGTFADTAWSTAKVFGLVNNCHAGRGHAGGKSNVANAGPAYDYVAGVFQVAAPADANRKASFMVGPMMYNQGYNRAADCGKLLGTAVISIPLGVSWDVFMEHLIAALPHSDKAEVQAKCHEKMTPLVAQLKQLNPIPVTYAPVEIHSDGSFRLVDPKAGCLCTRAGSPPSLGVISSVIHVARGGIVFDDLGIAQTCDEWFTPSLTYSGVDRLTSFTHRMGDVINMSTETGLSGSSTSPTYNEALMFNSQLHAIDGVRLERILGGLSGVNLSDTGETNLPASPINKTSADIVAQWQGAMRFAASSTAFVRRSDGQGVPETDAAYVTRLTTLAQTQGVETPLATRLTQWDGHGFTAGHGMMAFLAALDGATTDSNWISCLWPARQWIIPNWEPRQAGTYQAIATCAIPKTSLLPPLPV